MPSVDISAQTSKDERPFFGLDRILRVLLDDPLKEHVIVARMIRSGVTTNDVKGTSVPRIRPLHIEVVLDPGRRDEAIKILDAEYQDRTGKDETPPRDLFNQPGPGEHDGQTTVGQQVAEAEQRDPEAGPWPGDPDYVAPKA